MLDTRFEPNSVSDDVEDEVSGFDEDDLEEEDNDVEDVESP